MMEDCLAKVNSSEISPCTYMESRTDTTKHQKCRQKVLYSEKANTTKFCNGKSRHLYNEKSRDYKGL
jgi:hypothetical protein